ncbi:hypothetical protein Danklef4_17 [Polaribacter phage Danklef_4]|nr:hypothetical protein Danklef2_17 [Polaribacter phage Danklef_2]QQV90725.1 hypothetical protein Danklef4_17 [Polaribacter phage Danklef_4]QQV90802.1 hypothetical protein Danklef5_17 [Polaribacter phage Danklef_5]
MATATEIIDYADERLTPESPDTISASELREVIAYMANAMNASKVGYKTLKTIVRAEQYSLDETVALSDSSEKLVNLDSYGISILTVKRLAAGKYRITTSYDDENSSNIRENGVITVQCFHDIPSQDYLKNGSSTFPVDAMGLSTAVDFISVGVFDVYISDAGTLKDSNFYLTIDLYNFTT